MDKARLIDRLRLIEALRAGATTEGFRTAFQVFSEFPDNPFVGEREWGDR